MPKETPALVDEFANCVVAQQQAIARGDATTGNDLARRYVAAFKALRLRGDSGRDALAVLLSDSRSEVRVMAAAYLLRHCGASARSVLEVEAQGKGLTAFGAQEALKRWNEGSWSLDPA